MTHTTQEHKQYHAEFQYVRELLRAHAHLRADSPPDAGPGQKEIGRALVAFENDCQILWNVEPPLVDQVKRTYPATIPPIPNEVIELLAVDNAQEAADMIMKFVKKFELDDAHDLLSPKAFMATHPIFIKHAEKFEELRAKYLPEEQPLSVPKENLLRKHVRQWDRRSAAFQRN